MLKIVISLCLVLFASAHCFASNSQPIDIGKLYEQNSIYLQSGFFGRTFVHQGRSHQSGFFNSGLLSFMRTDPEAYTLMSDAISRQHIGIIIAISSLILIPITYDGYNNADWVMPLSLFGYIGGITITVSGLNLFEKSIWVYNRNMLQASYNQSLNQGN
ncbi:MAG: hypothetical protein OEZ58_13510 [Gammaproteobacteria bacterium]|nr:hypothetical protein [Gammaproteobacteria bacterium]MDH5730005.1 hypothetical protein [Gammaproteobacteria bacterium]